MEQKPVDFKELLMFLLDGDMEEVNKIEAYIKKEVKEIEYI